MGGMITNFPQFCARNAQKVYDAVFVGNLAGSIPLREVRKGPGRGRRDFIQGRIRIDVSFAAWLVICGSANVFFAYCSLTAPNRASTRNADGGALPCGDCWQWVGAVGVTI